MARALVALGSNQGDRVALLERALVELAGLRGTQVVAAADPVETAAERREDGGPFLNSAALLETSLPPRALLEHLHEVERRLGRERATPGRGPRLIDLDLILYERVVVRRGAGFELPHPRFRSRRFVLEPAAQIAPQMIDPVTRRTVADLLRLAPRGL
ncbi:MAG: 2-amino-4-hydroxy-6-hydroxymethyldihydropteridine diphosphokinase [Planctomycetes bacterium]|nr:2-amino-4-hydroxy-6-hydroxymethyldihydropteridine diphosphokinase [Planctomycetota bacterium]